MLPIGWILRRYIVALFIGGRVERIPARCSYNAGTIITRMFDVWYPTGLDYRWCKLTSISAAIHRIHWTSLAWWINGQLHTRRWGGVRMGYSSWFYVISSHSYVKCKTSCGLAHLQDITRSCGFTCVFMWLFSSRVCWQHVFRRMWSVWLLQVSYGHEHHSCDLVLRATMLGSLWVFGRNYGYCISLYFWSQLIVRAHRSWRAPYTCQSSRMTMQFSLCLGFLTWLYFRVTLMDIQSWPGIVRHHAVQLLLPGNIR